MSTRLEELQRQRELMRQHLAWLEREIADAAGRSPPRAAPDEVSRPGAAARTVGRVDRANTSSNPQETSAGGPGATAPAAESTLADELLARYGSSERLDPKAARSGCLLAAGLIVLVVVAAVVGIYFVFYAAR